jgi:tetratricopeptide (TPR) repeat protein
MNTINKHTASIFLGLCLIIFGESTVFAQNKPSSDDLFTEARKEAFDAKNYKKAISLAQQALQISPNYTDIQVFLGRLYTWTDKTDSARFIFKKVLTANPWHEDVLQANFDLEYWNDRFPKALEIAEVAVNAYPNRENFTTDKAKALRAMKQQKPGTRDKIKQKKTKQTQKQSWYNACIKLAVHAHSLCFDGFRVVLKS